MLVLHFDGNDRGGVRWKNTRSIKFTFLSNHAQKGLILQPNPIKWWVDFFFVVSFVTPFYPKGKEPENW